MQIQHRLARAGDFAAVAQMLELYQHELSDIWDQDLDAEGRYGYALERHRRAEHWFAHVGLADGRYAACALVSPAAVTRRSGCWMEQFFVLKKYRRLGLGAALAGQVIASHPGPWEIGQMPRNLPAQAFWRRTLGRLCGAGGFAETQVTQGAWQGVVQAFDWPPAGPPDNAAMPTRA